ncbi:hypothetical protein BDB01DRAFT_735889 [Pilobolus umbonatus]|nr:hypothetical protein BDB01DRAFT_735889 [Pilobolus umbonatus]
MSSTSTSDLSAIEYAQRIWDEDTTVYSNLDHIVEWIGNGKTFSNEILKSYISHFDFKELTLEQAFRNLCSKLHLKGETQQIDRILLEFSTHYYLCNPHTIYSTIDIIHTIVYSLLLLNTDLHVAQGDYKRMSRSEFIKSTMGAICAQVDSPAFSEDGLSDDHRTSGLSFQSFHWIPLNRTTSNQSNSSSRSSTYTPYSESSSAIGSKLWINEIKNALKQMYASIRTLQIANPSSPVSSLHNQSRISSVLKMWKSSRESFSSSTPDEEVVSPFSTINRGRLSRRTSFSSSISSNIFASQATYTCNTPYYKEGMVVRKHLLEKANQKAKHRDWKDCFMVIDRSELRMYKVDNRTENRKRNIIRNSLTTRSNLFDATSSDSCSEKSVAADWLANSQLVGTIDLKHTLANALPSGYSAQRQHAFALQQSNGAVHLFQASSAEQVHEWVATCNYWAARESKEPLSGGVSSMEYGWGRCLETTEDHINISEWVAPSPPTVCSLLDESVQLMNLRKHVKELNIELDQHRDLKLKMEERFSSVCSKLNMKAMTNWENKSYNLLHEIIKYQNYCDSIEKSLVLQSEVMLP